MRNVTLGTLLWTIAVIATCLAVYRLDVRYAPVVATTYAAYFLIRLALRERSSLGRYVRVGALSASTGVVCWLAIALSMDWSVTLQSGPIPDLPTTLAFFVSGLGGVVVYGVLGSIAGSVYGVLAYALQRSGTFRRIQNHDNGTQ